MGLDSEGWTWHPLWANRSSLHRSHRLGARPPTGARSSRRMMTATRFKRRPDEIPAIDIHSL